MIKKNKASLYFFCHKRVPNNISQLTVYCEKYLQAPYFLAKCPLYLNRLVDIVIFIQLSHLFPINTIDEQQRKITHQ